MSFFSLEGRTALITGSTRGIGASIAKRFAAAGAQVVINARDDIKKAEPVLSEIQSSSPNSFGVVFDISDSKQVDRGIQEILSKTEKIDICVCNAGISKDALIPRLSAELIEEVLKVNLVGSSQVIRAVSRPMMKARSGRIICISSVIGEMGNKGQAAYAASKAGLFGLVKSTAQELGSRKITCNAVAPGFIETDMTGELDSETRELYLSKIPLGRMASAEEVASTVHFLASEEAGYITGAAIDVNGGLYMR